jgi:hypothetical protein
MARSQTDPAVTAITDCSFTDVLTLGRIVAVNHMT